MNFMDLLSESDSKKLIELATQLKELSEKEYELVNQSNELIEKGNKIEKSKSDLNNKSKNYISLEDGKISVNINNSIDSEEFINLVTKSNDYKTEKENIEKEANVLYKELEDINKTREGIKNKIDEILSASSKEDLGINVKKIGTIHIIDAKLPDDIDKVSYEECKIINCSIHLINEIYNSCKNNVTNILLEDVVDSFTKLKAYASNYSFDKVKEYDSQLEIVNREDDNEKVIDSNEEVGIIEDKVVDLNNSSQNDKEETIELPNENKNEINVEIPVVELPKENIESLESVKEEPRKVEEPMAVIKDPVTLEVISEIRPDSSNSNDENNNKEETILPLSDIMNTKTEDSNVDDNKKILYILTEDKIVPNQIARATKDKLNNKILNIVQGSYPETKVERVSSLNETNMNNNFNIENFISNITA